MHDNLSSRMQEQNHMVAQAVHEGRRRGDNQVTPKSLGDWLLMLALGAPALTLLGSILWGLWRNGHLG